MVRLAISSVWICLVTIASIYASISMFMGVEANDNEEEFFGGLDYVKTDVISVPVISGGEIKGYIVSQFVFTIDANIQKRLSVPPKFLIVDEAFRSIFSGELVNFDKLQKYDIDRLRKSIVANTNTRFKADYIKDVLVEQMNFIPQSQVRYGPKR